MVSAAKLKRAQDAIIQMRPYANKLTELLVNLSSSLDSSEGGGFSSLRDVKSVLIVTVTSNRGLCGGFNANVIKSAVALINNDYKGKNVSIVSIGKKSSKFFRKNDFNLVSTHDDIYSDLSYDNISLISESIMNDYLQGTYDKVVLIYNQFKNAATQKIMNESYLPVEAPSEQDIVIGDYIFEPQKEEIVEQLIPKSLKTQLYKAVLDSHASEHGARMTAMHKATDNASELKKDLTLSYNKARQAAITAEILEIVGGAEALNG